jgi:hypothetical protein
VKGEIKVSLKYFINKKRTVILYKVYKIIRCRGTEVNEYVWTSLEKYKQVKKLFFAYRNESGTFLHAKS